MKMQMKKKVKNIFDITKDNIQLVAGHCYGLFDNRDSRLKRQQKLWLEWLLSNSPQIHSLIRMELKFHSFFSLSLFHDFIVLRNRVQRRTK